MSRAILPPAMTEEQLQGFRIGMACVATWGRQLVTAAHLPRPDQRGEDLAETAALGHGLITCAEALDRTIGAGRGRARQAARPG